jgi:hypothetical protein
LHTDPTNAVFFINDVEYTNTDTLTRKHASTRDRTPHAHMHVYSPTHAYTFAHVHVCTHTQREYSGGSQKARLRLAVQGTLTTGLKPLSGFTTNMAKRGA